jgi:nucleoside-diphosphate-sugar epimerase
LLWHLLQNNNRVIAIRRSSSNLKPLHSIFSFYSSDYEDFLSRIEWRIADVLESNSLEVAMHDVTVVYHCAAIVTLGNGGADMLKTNVLGTKNIVNAALKSNIKKLCFVSSIAACGKAENQNKVDENTPWNDKIQNSQYARSKYYSEQEIWNGISRGLDTVIVNPGVILGFSGTNTGSSQLFAEVKKGLLFYTNGGSGYVDVKDVVKTMILLTNSEVRNKRFILVSENCTNKYILSLMADGFKKRRPFILIGKNLLIRIARLLEFLSKVFKFKPFIDTSTARSASNIVCYSNSKIKNTLKYSFQPISSSIEEICEFELKNSN